MCAELRSQSSNDLGWESWKRLVAISITRTALFEILLRKSESQMTLLVQLWSINSKIVFHEDFHLHSLCVKSASTSWFEISLEELQTKNVTFVELTMKNKELWVIWINVVYEFLNWSFLDSYQMLVSPLSSFKKLSLSLNLKLRRKLNNESRWNCSNLESLKRKWRQWKWKQ